MSRNSKGQFVSSKNSKNKKTGQKPGRKTDTTAGERKNDRRQSSKQSKSGGDAKKRHS